MLDCCAVGKNQKSKRCKANLRAKKNKYRILKIAPFLLENIRTGQFFHYIHENKKRNSIWYKGKIKEIDEQAFNNFMFSRILEKTQHEQNNLFEKYNITIPDEINWKFIAFDEFPSAKIQNLTTIPYIQVLYGKKPDFKTKMISINDLDSFPKDAIAWRYQTPYTELYDLLWK